MTSKPKRPEPARRLPVRSAMGYVEEIAVPPGGTVRFHVSAPSAYRLDVVRLGRRAILERGAERDADRTESELVASFERPVAAQRSIEPGSYVFVAGDAVPAGPMTCGAWIRPWRLPPLDEVQWAWSGIVSDLDYPESARFALLVDHLGRIGAYVGDGGAFDHERMHCTGPLLRGQLGRWLHVAMSVGRDGLRILVDGTTVLARAPAALGGFVGLVEPGPRSRLRIGASAERAAAADHLDADIAAPFVAATALADPSIGRLVEDRGRTPLAALGLGPLHGAWDLAEERGAWLRDSSGNGRDGLIAQGGTWQVGGPAHLADGGVADYEPGGDPERGHGLRLSSDDLADCEWPVTEAWQVPEDADSGVYAGLLRLAGQPEEDARPITFVVARRRPRRPGSVALLAATNTWYAYGRRPADTDPAFGLSASFYSTHANGRPHFWLTTQAPIPRATPFGFESERAGFVGHSHLVRPERYAEAWLEREGYAYELVTDHDLHAEPGLLRDFQVLLVAGHSEYWSDEARDGVEAFLDAGGRVLSLSGNSIMWRVTFDAGMTILECRKEVDEDDPRWLDPRWWGERWHAHDGRAGGSWRRIGRHPHETLGLDPQGMIDDGTPTGFRPLRVVAPEHPLFREPEPVPIDEDGTIGRHGLNGPMVGGYEFDALREVVGSVDQPLPGLTLLATTEQPNLEWSGQRSDRGADLIDWVRPGGGRVVSLGSIGATGSLGVDAGISAFVRNVLAAFGAARDERA